MEHLVRFGTVFSRCRKSRLIRYKKPTLEKLQLQGKNWTKMRKISSTRRTQPAGAGTNKEHLGHPGLKAVFVQSFYCLTHSWMAKQKDGVSGRAGAHTCDDTAVL